MIRTTPTLSVFTPAYNRAHTIWRTYESLCRQTSHDFHWVLVDDGSRDNTRELVKSWLSSDGLTITKNEFVGHSKDSEWLYIHYIYKENGGMASAHNIAYDNIDTELSVCIDSDDWMPDNGVELIVNRWKAYGGVNYSGMIGLDVSENGNVIGTCFPKGLKSCKIFDMKRKFGVVDDKKYVIKVAEIKKHLPYPIYPGEKNLEVNYIYDQMSVEHDFLCFNDNFCIVEYQEDGLTAGIFRQYVQSPKSYMYSRNAHMNSSPYFDDHIRQAIHFVSSAIFARDWHFLKSTNKKFLVIMAIPLGMCLNAYVRWKNRKL